MASPAILDLEKLLAPIAGTDPKGQALPFEKRAALDEKRKEIDPNTFAANDPRRPTEPQHADWQGIEQLTQDILTGTSKDVLVAVRLLEALVKRHGFAGLRDGLRLLQRLMHEAWDRMYPIIEDGDMDARAAPFFWLDDENRAALFPVALRLTPLVKALDDQTKEEQKYAWQHWKEMQDGKGKVSADAFNRAVMATPREFCQAAVDDIGESVAELTELTKILSAQMGPKMGDQAPSMSRVRAALLDCQSLAQQILQKKGPAPVAAPADPAKTGQPGESAPNGAAEVAIAKRRLTREDVLARLADASAILLQMEPHSPIAYMIQRAVRLARLPFPDLMRVLVRDPGVLGQLDRDLDLGLEKLDAAKAPAPKK